MSYLGKKVTDKWHNFRNEDLKPYKDFSVKDQNKNYDLNLGAFVGAYQEFIKFMKKHKEVPDGNKKEWAFQIREKVGQAHFNGYIGLFTQPIEVLKRFKKFEKEKNKDFHFTEGKQINENFTVIKADKIDHKVWRNLKYDLQKQFYELEKIGQNYQVFQNAQGTAKILKQIKKLMHKL